MEEQVYQVGPLMKAARKFKKLNQADVAQAIGCSQSALSKMEHNLLVPSAPQWFLFARFTSIPPETLETGVIDRHSKVRFNDDEVSLGFKIPKKYRTQRAEKARELYPYLLYLEKNLSPPRHQEFILSSGLDPEFFLDFDNLINFQLYLDMVNFFIKIGKDSPGEIKGIVHKGQNDIYWDHLKVEWAKFNSSEEVLESFAREQSFFQADFKIQVEREGGELFVTYVPETHLSHYSEQATPQVVAFLNHYRGATLEHLIERTLGQKVQLVTTPTITQSPLAARFQLRS
jgi:transcriptional regulator with XRE-family HTH domain